ncbi:DUF4870 domain-containing protein [Phycicoccus sp.]|uniref:DUF4870 domain-containing protein n=1 Tax=Phycicoccus sp. TaxID=1902410 RepID=UPI002C58CCA8|nr:DUF4870 domain-containing protein [Phycicoccus sp.]HMM96895.1 DUF4870 domain-containing protein [Phycicoccus sp.]
MSENTPRDDAPQGTPEPPPAPEAPAVSEQAPPPPPGAQYAAPEQQYAAPQYQQSQYQQPQYQQPYPAPAAPTPISPQEEKQWAMLSHVIGAVAMVVTSGVLGFVGSLIIYLLYKDRGPFVRAHSANSLNIQITTAIGVVISFVLMLVLVGFVTIFVVGIWALVMHIIGAVKANNGEWWDPPLVPKFVR